MKFINFIINFILILECSTICKKCEFNKDNCIECWNSENIRFSSNCECMESYYDDNIYNYSISIC